MPAASTNALRRSLSPASRRAPRLALALFLAVAGCSSHEATAPTTILFSRNPCLPADTVRLAVDSVAHVDCSNGGTTVTFAAGGASYLVVPEFATDQAPFQLVAYQMDSGEVSGTGVSARWQGASAALFAPLAAADRGALPPPRNMTAQNAADAFRRARARRLAEAGAFRAAAAAFPRFLQGAPAAPPQRATPAAGSLRAFSVATGLDSTSGYATVTARLDYVGANVLVYVDTLAPAGGFDSTQLQTYGQYFDQVLYPIDTTAFGPPTDIDQNGHVIVLMTPTVNAVTSPATCNAAGYVAGFFNEEDFNGPTDPYSNQGEIFYTIVADPLGAYSCAHSVGEVEFSVPATFLHELQHLINFGEHVVIDGGLPGASWLDEGLSIAAEEEGSLHYERQCPPPACRTNPDQLFPDSSQGFVQDFLYDSYLYAFLPDTASITLENDAGPGLSWRGGAWLLVRWLADRTPGLYRALERGPSGGVADIEQATGQSFPSLFADFGLALYTDSLPGLPRSTAPLADRFVSRNVKQLWARLYVTSGGSGGVTLVDPVQLFQITGDTSSAVLYPGTVTYFRLDTPAKAATVSIRFAAPGGAAFASGLQPRIAVFRLPPGQ